VSRLCALLCGASAMAVHALLAGLLHGCCACQQDLCCAEIASKLPPYALTQMHARCYLTAARWLGYRVELQYDHAAESGDHDPVTCCCTMSCREAAAVVQSFGSLGGLMSHLSNSSLSQQQREAQVANLKPEGAKKRIGPAKVSRMVQLLMSTDPDEVIEFGSWEEEQQG
jgi:hypothetical protein